MRTYNSQKSLKLFASPNPAIMSVQNNEHNATKQNRYDQNINNTGFNDWSFIEVPPSLALVDFSITTLTMA